MKQNEQINLNYVYLGVLFTLVQLFDGLYSITLTSEYSLFGGDIAYSALIFATIYLISSQPEPKVVRNLIYIFIINALLLFLIFGLINGIQDSEHVVNYLDNSELLLEFTFKSLLFSLFLFSSEILVILFFIKKITLKYQAQLPVTIALGLGYVVILILDGILYPIGTNFLFPGSNLSIANGMIAKFIFGFGFGTILVGLLIVRPHNLSDFIANKTPIIHYLFPPRRAALERQLAQAEEKIDKLEEIVPICAKCNKIRDDEEYWNQLERVRQSFISGDQELSYSNKYCLECSETMTN
ncbi:MAG: hypothetical protein HeimC2_30370 [Candidatus Heimdallarchaeota archaeon LC_2]|nr:MAG: hypothetical protein HeimC2_30370 [Candidatus Heimdallarchaeota archaeon LC_2]